MNLFEFSGISSESGKEQSQVLQKLEENMKEEGLLVEISQDNKQLKVVGQLADTKGRIFFKTNEMIQKTVKLNENY